MTTSSTVKRLKQEFPSGKFFLAGKHFVGGSLGYKRPNWGVPTGLSPPALVSHKSCRGPLIDFISEVLQYRRHPWWPLFVYLARRLAMHPESLRRACLVRMPSTTRIKATKGAKDFEKTWRCIRRFEKNRRSALACRDGEWEDMAETIPIGFVGGAGE